MTTFSHNDDDDHLGHDDDDDHLGHNDDDHHLGMIYSSLKMQTELLGSDY